MTLLDQFQSAHTSINAILKALCEEVQAPSHANIPIEMLYQVYIDTLKDARKMLNSMIDYLSKRV